ncbi:hypothetical protein B0H13DRAFT_1863684 [Mycena leptocephala]|nr:hypothetical protein B0H13DRAFT_1863684 [Mycena leptocephala]
MPSEWKSETNPNDAIKFPRYINISLRKTMGQDCLASLLHDGVYITLPLFRDLLADKPSAAETQCSNMVVRLAKKNQPAQGADSRVTRGRRVTSNTTYTGDCSIVQSVRGTDAERAPSPFSEAPADLLPEDGDDAEGLALAVADNEQQFQAALAARWSPRSRRPHLGPANMLARRPPQRHRATPAPDFARAKPRPPDAINEP